MTVGHNYDPQSYRSKVLSPSVATHQAREPRVPPSRESLVAKPGRRTDLHLVVNLTEMRAVLSNPSLNIGLQPDRAHA